MATGISRDDIRAAAVKAFSANGYRGTNLGEVAAELGVTRQAIYYHYPNKHALLFEMFDLFFEDLRTAVKEVGEAEADPTVRFEKMLREHVLRVIGASDLTSIFTREFESLDPDAQKLVRKWRQEYQRSFVTAFEEMVATGGARPLPPGPAVSLVIGAANWTFRWYDPRKMDADDLVALLLGLVRDGYAPRD
jgi:TetR/AcrR family transcriptional regulator, cholesterol catabolism regulator